METVANVAISLPEPTWQAIMNALADRPYKEVAQLLAEMDTQIKAAKAPKEE